MRRLLVGLLLVVPWSAVALISPFGSDKSSLSTRRWLCAEGPLLTKVEDARWLNESDMRSSDLILEADDGYAWVEERREYSVLLQSEDVPSALRGVYKGSLALSQPPLGGVRYLHAFDAQGYDALTSVDWTGWSVSERLELVVELIEAVRYLHLRGLPHLSLNSEFVRVGRKEQVPGLKIIGVGAGPKLVATKRPFSIPEAWPFNAPETMSGAIIESNLNSLLLMDAWSVGVLVAMIVGRDGNSAFAAPSTWPFSERQAVSAKIREVFADFSQWLLDLGKRSGGLLFASGWLLQVLLGLLRVQPGGRMTIRAANDCIIRARPPSQEDEAVKQQKKQENEAIKQRKKLSDEDEFQEKKKQEEKALPPPAKKELGRYGPRATVSDLTTEPFRSLEAILNIANQGECDCVLEPDRSTELGMPYGEVVGFRNRADGDRWDIFVPGLALNPKSVVFQERMLRSIRRVLGVVLIKGGNHKLAVELHDPRPTDAEAVLTDVRKFIDIYAELRPQSKKRIRYLEYQEYSSDPENP